MFHNLHKYIYLCILSNLTFFQLCSFISSWHWASSLCCFDSGFGFVLQYFFYASQFLMTKLVKGCCSCALNCLWCLIRRVPGKKWKVMGSCMHALTCVSGHSSNTVHLLRFQALWMSLSYAFYALCIFYILFIFSLLKFLWRMGICIIGS